MCRRRPTILRWKVGATAELHDLVVIFTLTQIMMRCRNRFLNSWDGRLSLIQSVIQNVIPHIPRKVSNISSISVKTDSSTALPIYNKVREEHKLCNVGKKDPKYYYVSNCGGICDSSNSDESGYYTDSSCDWMSD